MQQTEGVKHHCTALAELTNVIQHQNRRLVSFPLLHQHHTEGSVTDRLPSDLTRALSSQKFTPLPKLNSDRRYLHTPKSRERIWMPAKFMWVNAAKYSQQKFVTF